jgi:hypothetical protein
MIRWLYEKWEDFIDFLRYGPIETEPEELVSFAGREWQHENMHSFMQQYQGLPFDNPMPGDTVWFVRGGRVLGGVLLEYVDGGCEVEVPERGVVYVKHASANYDDAFERLMWQQSIPGTKNTKAPHLKLVTDDE